MRKSPFLLLGILLLDSLLLAACTPTPPRERFYKLSADGHSLALDQGPWACVVDRASGLTWENPHFNEDAHYRNASYSWYSAGLGAGLPAGGSCQEDRQSYACDTQDLLSHSRLEKLCGFDDWRLPTQEDWQSLAYLAAHPGRPQVPHALFPALLPMRYWSADTRIGPNGFEVAAIDLADRSWYWLSPRLPLRTLLVRGLLHSDDLPIRSGISPPKHNSGPHPHIGE